jgi:hypothetical protein
LSRRSNSAGHAVIHPARSQRERMDTAELREALEEALSRRSGTQRHVAETPRLRQGVEAAIAASRCCTVSGEDKLYFTHTYFSRPKLLTQENDGGHNALHTTDVPSRCIYATFVQQKKTWCLREKHRPIKATPS